MVFFENILLKFELCYFCVIVESTYVVSDSCVERQINECKGDQW